MLFLAVSLGFLTENLREKYQDHLRITEFMCKMKEDLQIDISEMDHLSKERLTRNSWCDTLINLLKNSPEKNSREKLYYYGRTATRRIHFRPQNATLEQLKNTGSIRLVEDHDVLAAINDYDRLLKLNEENILVEEKELSEISELSSRIFDATVFQDITSNGIIKIPSGNPALMSYDKNLLNQLSVKLHYWKRTSLTVLESFKQLDREAKGLKFMIGESYRCKEEKRKED